MSPSLLVAGAINTDLVMHVDRVPSAGETVTGRGFSEFGGGKGANQAVAAVRSGANVTLLAACGDDSFGVTNLQRLRQESISTEHVRVVTGASSGIAIVLVEPSGENRIACDPGANSLVQPAEAMRCVETVRPDLVLATNELPAAALKSLFATCQAASIPVVFNAAPEPSQVEELLPMVDVLIVNETEAQVILGRAGNQGITSLRKLGPQAVIITQGARGALICDEMDSIHHVAALPVTAVDTTAAGDTFCGAFTAALLHGEGMRDAVQYGVRGGSIATTTLGAQPSIPTRRLIEQHALLSG